MEARHGVMDRSAAAAHDRGAEHVLQAGDTFDTATPSATVVRQALAAIAEAADVTWLPGNHDDLRDTEPLWATIRREAPGNVVALTEAAPRDLGEVATLLTCPIAFRSGASDPSEPLLTMASDEGRMRIGLAHGSVTDFTDAGEAIAPDRDRSARLDHLALGDWYGRMAVSDRVQYSGTPEQDRFKHGRRGICLCVELDGPGATPKVEEVETGAFLWREIDLPLHPRQDAAAALTDALPPSGRRDILMRVAATGWAGLPDWTDLERAATACAPEFAHFDLVTDALDLDEIDRGGALRLAANILKKDADSDALSQEDRNVAADALVRLYGYVRVPSE